MTAFLSFAQKDAPLTAAVVQARGVLHPVDRHKKVEKRRQRAREEHAWRRQPRNDLEVDSGTVTA